MSRPSVRIVLDAGDEGRTWVTVAPLEQLDHIGAQQAAGDAFVGFMRSLCRDEGEITRRLMNFEAQPSLSHP